MVQRIAEHGFMWECSVVKAQNVMVEFMGMQRGNRLYYFCVSNNLVDVVVFDLSVQFLCEPPRCSTSAWFLSAIWPFFFFYTYDEMWTNDLLLLYSVYQRNIYWERGAS